MCERRLPVQVSSIFLDIAQVKLRSVVLSKARLYSILIAKLFKPSGFQKKSTDNHLSMKTTQHPCIPVYDQLFLVDNLATI